MKSNKVSEKKTPWGDATKSIRIMMPKTNQLEHSTPIFLTSSFCYDSAETMAEVFESHQYDRGIYSRFTNPNTSELAMKVAALEEAEAGVCFATGIASIFASLMSFLKNGDHIISSAAIFGTSYNMISKYLVNWGITSSFFDINHPESIAKIIRKNTKILYVETPSNPAINIIDLSFLSALCKKNNILLVVDNCFATPIFQKPIRWGADIVLHSATKYFDGQGRVLGGVVVGNKEHIHIITDFLRNIGGSMSAFNAWIISKSIETLSVRMEKHADNALQVATLLSTQTKYIKWVKYPFLPSHPQYAIAKKQMTSGGGLLSFELAGGIKAGRRFLNALSLLSVTNNLGDAKSIVSHPASTSHSALTEEQRLAVGITPGMIRISVGLENVQDIIYDILTALKKK